MKTKLLALFLVLCLTLTFFAACSDDKTDEGKDGNSTVDPSNKVEGEGEGNKTEEKVDPAVMNFTLNEDGSGYILSSVDIKDTQLLNIPAMHEGKPVVAIAPGILAGCESLTGLVISNNITTIGENAFARCIALKSLQIGSAVKTIGTDAFFGCTGLQSVTVHAANIHFEDENGTVYDRMTGTVLFTTGNLYVPTQGVSIIGDGAFAFRSIGAITIPTNITTLGKNLFYGCTAVTTFHYDGTVAGWNAITKDPEWNANAPVITVICSDGNVTETYTPPVVE